MNTQINGIHYYWSLEYDILIFLAIGATRKEEEAD